MRQLIFILTFIVWTTYAACGQTKTKSNSEKSKLDIATVDVIEINNKSERPDTIQLDKKLLTEQQKNEFVTKSNNSKSVGPIKSITRFFITVHCKDGSIRIFRGSEQHLLEGNDFGFDLESNRYRQMIEHYHLIAFCDESECKI